MYEHINFKVYNKSALLYLIAPESGHQLLISYNGDLLCGEQLM